MDHKKLGTTLAKMLIEYNNINNASYNSVLDKCLDKLNINELTDRHIVTNNAIHELAVLGYDIVTTKPFKMENIKN